MNRTRTVVALVASVVAVLAGGCSDDPDDAPASAAEHQDEGGAGSTICADLEGLALERFEEGTETQVALRRIAEQVSAESRAVLETVLAANDGDQEAQERLLGDRFEAAWAVDIELYDRCGIPIFTLGTERCSMFTRIDTELDGDEATPTPDARSCGQQHVDQLGGFCFVDRPPMVDERPETPIDPSPLLRVDCSTGDASPYDGFTP